MFIWDSTGGASGWRVSERSFLCSLSSNLTSWAGSHHPAFILDMSVNGGASMDCVRMLQSWEYFSYLMINLCVESVYCTIYVLEY